MRASSARPYPYTSLSHNAKNVTVSPPISDHLPPDIGQSLTPFREPLRKRLRRQISQSRARPLAVVDVQDERLDGSPGLGERNVELQRELNAYLDDCNRKRPHRALNGLAPLEFLAMMQEESVPEGGESQM